MTESFEHRDIRVVAFARYPEPGACKTRLIPAVGPDGAARIHKRLVEICITSMRASGLRMELHITGASQSAFVSWLGDDICFVEQGDGDLGARLLRATSQLPVMLIGSDAPGLDAARLIEAAAALHKSPAVIGPAEDGGYYLLGLREASPWLFNDMAWGTNTVFVETMARFAAHGISPIQLNSLSDVDRPEDLQRWPELLA